jgi:hypothetical protein
LSANLAVYALPRQTTTHVRFLSEPVAVALHWLAKRGALVPCQETGPGLCRYRKKGVHLPGHEQHFAAAQVCQDQPARPKKRVWRDVMLCLPADLLAALAPFHGAMTGVWCSVLMPAHVPGPGQLLRSGRDEIDPPPFDVLAALKEWWCVSELLVKEGGAA